MLLRLILTLTCLLVSVSSNSDIPTTLSDLKYVVIDSYHGSLESKTLELFDKVETISFRNCNFSVFHENFLHPLKNLQKLVISNCHFNKVKHDLTSCCRNLRTIEVYGSSYGAPVSKEDFQKIAAMSPVRTMLLARMDLPTLFAKSMAGSNIETLGIERSNLATIEDGAFEGMDKLKVLNLERNKLEKFPPVGELKGLVELNLEGNLLKKVTTEDFPALPNLEKLNLGRNPIEEIDLKGLKGKLPKLQWVDVSGVDIDPAKNEGIQLVKHEVL